MKKMLMMHAYTLTLLTICRLLEGGIVQEIGVSGCF